MINIIKRVFNKMKAEMKEKERIVALGKLDYPVYVHEIDVKGIYETGKLSWKYRLSR